jgi:hypothetical protein
LFRTGGEIEQEQTPDPAAGFAAQSDQAVAKRNASACGPVFTAEQGSEMEFALFGPAVPGDGIPEQRGATSPGER